MESNCSFRSKKIFNSGILLRNAYNKRGNTINYIHLGEIKMNTKKLTAEIEVSKFDKFKVICAINGKTIKEVIEDFITFYIAQNSRPKY